MNRFTCLLGLVCCLGVELSGQTYQSSFTEVKYDRAKSPATFHGGAQVDLPSGAVTYNIPLGPGIGARGVRYVPTLSNRFAPQVPPPNPYGGSSQVHPGGISCVLTPGYYVLSAGAPDNGQGGLTDDEYLLPDGSTGSGLASPSVTGQSSTSIDPRGIIQSFGITGATASSWRSASRGELILAISGTSYPSRNVYQWRPTLEFPNPPAGSSVPVTFPAPGGIVVVSPDGETATVFSLVNPQFQIEFPGSPWQATNPTLAAAQLASGGKYPNELLAVHYLPTMVCNRFGDRITFDHFTGVSTYGLDFTATWTTRGGASSSLTVKVVGPAQTASPAGWINGSAASGTNVRIQVSYSEGNVSTYSVDAFGYQLWAASSPTQWGLAMSSPWDRFRRNLQPTQVTVNATGESVKFIYQAAYTDGSTGLLAPVTLQGLEFSQRKIAFGWQLYRYRRPIGGTVFSEYGQAGVGYTDIASALGVVRVDDQDLTTGGQTRTTTYTRTLPIPDLRYDTGPYWTSTAFTVGVKHPDGSGTLTRYAEPLQNVIFSPSTWNDAAKVFQALAYLKHLPVEIREYEIGADFSLDAQVGQGGAAFRGVLYGPPAGQGRFAVTGFDNDAWSLKQVGNPAGTAGFNPYPLRTESWGPEGTRVETKASWDASNYGWQAATVNANNPVCSKTLQSSFTFTSNPSLWHWGQVRTESRPDQPLLTRNFNADATLDSIQASAVGVSTVETKFGYAGGWPQPSSVTLNGPGLMLSGLLGARYEFDPFGYLKTIIPSADAGITWNYARTQDSIGRPTSQTDPHGVKTTFDYDGAGRLLGIHPPAPESGTTVGYDPDNLGVTISRGSQSTHLRYNGFGELVSESRATPNGIKTITFAYDLAGRRTFASVWGGAAGTQWTYDNQGRLSTTTDPNGIKTLTTYSGPNRTVTVGDPGGRSTTFSKDCLGRLASVTDALGQPTTYDYDDAGRVRSAVQSGSQTRSWHYNGMGWLDTLVQPETGTTSYSGFTVAGKPTVSAYAGTRQVTTTPDSLGRAISVTANDGSVNQSFHYDLDRLDYSLDKRVRLRFEYLGLNGRLSTLTTTVWDADAATPAGAGEFAAVQTFDYSPEGIRKKATIDGRSQDLTLFDTLGTPQKVSYSGVGLNLAPLGTVSAVNDSGSPTDLIFANGASSHADYRPDGVGLALLRHNAPGLLLPRQWSYTYPTSGLEAGLLTSDGEDSFHYDGLERLVSATVKVPGLGVSLGQSYEYDAFGNPLASTTTGLGALPAGMAANFANFRFNPADLAGTNRLPAQTMATTVPGNGTVPSNPTGATYDGQGNLTGLLKQPGAAARWLSFQYDALGRVIQMVDNERGVTEKYYYTPDGLRTRIETWQGIAPQALVLQKVEHRIYNDQRQLVSEYEAVAQ